MTESESPKDQAEAATELDILTELLDLDHFKQINDTLGHAAGAGSQC